MKAAPIEMDARSGHLDRIAAVLLFAAGMCFFVLRATDWFRSVPGDLADARFNSVILEHLYQWVRGDAASLWSPGFFYPTRGTLAFSDNHFGSGPVYILFRFAGLSREHAFDAWFTLGCILNFVAMYAVMRRLRFAPFAASVAAFIFAFNLPAQWQAAHAQLTYRFAIPMGYLAFLRFAEDRSIQRLAPLAAWTALQFFCSIYLGVFMVFLLAATAVAMLLPSLRPSAPSGIQGPPTQGRAGPITVVVACAVATAALLLKYQLVSRSYGFSRSTGEVMAMLPRPTSYLLADRVAAYKWLNDLAPELMVRNEHQMFLGFVAMLLALYALVTVRLAPGMPRRQLVDRCLVSVLLLVIATLYVDGKSIYQLVMSLPGISSIRAVSRIILVIALPVAIMAAVGIEQLQRSMAARWLVVVLVITGLSAETLAFLPYNTSVAAWKNRLTSLAEAVADSPLKDDSVIYVTGREQEQSVLSELDGAIFAQDRKRPTLNGYSGNFPPGYVPQSPCTSPLSRIHSLASTVLTRRGLTADALVSRTRWIALEPCALHHPAVDAAGAPPDEAQASAIQLSASVTSIRQEELQVILRIRNNGTSMLNTVSRVGHPLRLSWRFVRMPLSDGLARPGWDTRQEFPLSLPPGGEESLRISVSMPRENKGPYELQFSIVAEDYRWLHDLGMPIARVVVDSKAAQPR